MATGHTGAQLYLLPMGPSLGGEVGGAAASVDGRPFGLMEGTDGPVFTVSTLPFAAVHTRTIPGLVLGQFSLCSVNIIQLWSLGCTGRE